MAGARSSLLAVSQVLDDGLQGGNNFGLFDLVFREADFQVELLRWRPVGKDVVFGTSGLRFAAASRICWRVAPPWLAIFSIKAIISLACSCLTICRSSDLDEMSASRQRFLTSSGIP